MIRRVFWLGVGIAIGALVVRKVAKAAESYTPAGIARSVRKTGAGMVESVRTFVEDVREGMAERENEIRAALAHGEVVDGEHLGDPDYPAAGREDGPVR